MASKRRAPPKGGARTLRTSDGDVLVHEDGTYATEAVLEVDFIIYKRGVPNTVTKIRRYTSQIVLTLKPREPP